MNPVLEVTERASPTYGVTQIISYVLIVYREAETLHNTILINLESVGQREIVIGFQNLPSDTNRVMLPVREVFERGVLSAARNSSSVMETTSPVVRLRKEDCSSD
jgi:hypothetical protein